ncbi:S-methyl-5'-thioadenosine phosphorylase [Candidatus Berkiella aquae]|uniref:Purine nucleoside phosphorylase n=1 Tax=Candidatus Berkiella aquae TaxID=295108 RepID=A0A0Q9YVW4_9GAMM|nr:S-methyl-5'-thioadenosine phosphorylase [Candidatus Berkiella aquae]MCS5711316.1 S-methyl-5'-thioadenosine phosphorylase [Candidatus Berkiella aquae]
MWAVLGGSGFEKFDSFQFIEEIEVTTPFGKPSAPITKAKVNDVTVLFLSRHGKHHEFTPSNINYRANIFALKQCGATKILSLSAVGSLQAELKPGDCVIPTQYIDRTKSLRGHTFCIDGAVGHVSLANPVDLELVKHVKEFLTAENFTLHFDKTYICMEGPAFSTKAESKMYRMLGADIIGMTNYPEYALAREAGLCYLPLSFVTDYDSWNDSLEHVTLEQVLEIMRNNNHKAFNLMQQLLPQTQMLFPEGCSEQGLKTGLMTPIESLSPTVQAWMKVVCK